MAEELDPRLVAYMEKFGVTVEAVTAAMKANAGASRGLNSEALRQIQAQAELTRSLRKSLKLNESDAAAMARRMKAEEDAFNKQKKRDSEQEQVDAERKAAAKKLVDDIKNFATGSIQASQAVYNSTQSFAAVIPTLQLLGSATKSVMQAMAGLGTGIPFISGMFSAAEKLAGAAVDITMSVMQAQLDNAQKMADTFVNLSKVGVTFGGSLDNMVRTAGAAGMSLDSYSKFVLSNVDSLRLLGGSVESGAKRVTALGASIVQGDRKLLALYGSVDALQGGVLDFMAQQARYGVSLGNDRKALNEGAKEYLYNMKELSNLTGKSAEELKKREQERQNIAAYQMQMARMDVTARENTRKSIETTATIYGSVAEKYATEFVATNGRVMSEQGLLFKSQFPLIAATVEQSIAQARTAGKNFSQTNADLIAARRAGIREEVEGKQGLNELYAAGIGRGELFNDTLNSVAATTMQTFDQQRDIVKAAAEAERTRSSQIDAGTEAFADIILKLNKFKIDVDEMTRTNLPKIGEVAKGLLDAQTVINKMVNENLNKAVLNVTEQLKKLFDALKDVNVKLEEDREMREESRAGRVPGEDRVRTQGKILTGPNAGITMKPAMPPAEFDKAMPFEGRGAVKSNVAGLKFKSGFDRGQGGVGEVDLRMNRLLEMIAADFPGATITAANDGHGSHARGRAIDFTLPEKYFQGLKDPVDWSQMTGDKNTPPPNAANWDRRPDRLTGKEIVNILKGYGFKTVLDEYNNPSKNATGGHIHAEFQKGGVVDAQPGGKNIKVGEGGIREGVFPADPNNPFPFKMDQTQFSQWMDMQRQQIDFLEKILQAQ